MQIYLSLSLSLSLSDRLLDRHLCLNLYPCVIKVQSVSQSVSQSVTLSLSLSLSLCLSLSLSFSLSLCCTVNVLRPTNACIVLRFHLSFDSEFPEELTQKIKNETNAEAELTRDGDTFTVVNNFGGNKETLLQAGQEIQEHRLRN